MRELTATSVTQVRVQQFLYGIMIAFSVFMAVFLAVYWPRGLSVMLVFCVVGIGIWGTSALIGSFRLRRFLASPETRALVLQTHALKGLGFDEACERLEKRGRRVREEQARSGDPRVGFKQQRITSYDCGSLFVTLWESAGKVARVALFVPPETTQRT